MNLQGSEISYLGAFLGGLAVGFSPCVYPLIPITLTFIGVRADSSRLKGLLLSLVYVFGLSITYSILGLIASLTGKLFGEMAKHPLSYFLIANACIIAGLSFLDVLSLNFTGLNLANKVKRNSGFFSVFLLGAVSGLIVGPCLTPALGTILFFVASKQNIIYGASLLFVFAYGMGILLIISGTFGAAFLSLSKSGVWLARLRKISGFVLIAAGEYFLIKAGSMIW
ncbi:MAG: sulfite exporter TauE/SafE family protein [Candidatus Omnitrophica bacterium]|nr:sulfite exporter TauE/SafE family protein [Candidatus Omnitrophota bacterium]